MLIVYVNIKYKASVSASVAIPAAIISWKQLQLFLKCQNFLRDYLFGTSRSAAGCCCRFLARWMRVGLLPLRAPTPPRCWTSTHERFTLSRLHVLSVNVKRCGRVSYFVASISSRIRTVVSPHCRWDAIRVALTKYLVMTDVVDPSSPVTLCGFSWRLGYGT